MKLKLTGVEETLLITLYVRAKDAESDKPVLNDRKAAEILSRIDNDLSQFKTAWMSYYGILARAKLMDEEIRKFIKKNPDGVIVSLGSGLDTRFYRVDNGKIRWYDIDFPEVITLRKQLIGEHPRVTSVSKSMLDASWPEEIDREGKKLLVISEGVIMYLEEEEVKKLLALMADGLDEFEAHFDLLYKGLVRFTKKHDAVKYTQAEFKWGVTDGREIVRFDPRWQYLECINFTREMKHLLPGWKKLLTPFFYLTNNRLGKYTYKKQAPPFLS